MSKKIFNTVITSERHRKYGFCEESDFETIELFELEKAEKELVVKFNDYDGQKEYISFNNYAFEKIDNKSYLGNLSTEIHRNLIKKQGYFTPQTAINFILRIRESSLKTYSYIRGFQFVLIGRTLYVSKCKLEDLQIGVTGNMLFAHWISICIEPKNENKRLYKLNKKNFNKVVKEEYARWKEGDPKTTNIDGGTHSCFSKPTKIKWGELYK